jgi:hypothetical protein
MLNEEEEHVQHRLVAHLPCLLQEGEDEGVRRPSKRRKLTRTVSINTILQRVGSKEEPLADVIGTAPQTVEDIVALQNTLASQASPPGP